MERLEQLREGIDEADIDLVRALAQRMSIVDEIAHEKGESGRPVYDAERERVVLRRMAERARELALDIRLVERVAREIIRHSREKQVTSRARMIAADHDTVSRVAYQGAPGSFSWSVVRRHFGAAMEGIACRSFAEAVHLLCSGAVQRAVLPAQNSTAGAIREVHELLAESDLAIVAEEYLPVNHCLIGLPGSDPCALRRVLSHPVALQQCGKFLAAHPELEAVAWFDTAGAVAKVRADADASQAAIAGEEAAEVHGLHVLRAGIADQPDNQTRFWIVAREPRLPPADMLCKTSLVLVTEHREGALVRCLQSFAAFGVNLLRLESQPLPGRPSEHRFFIDCDGNPGDERLSAALTAVRAYAVSLKILGCYPRDCSGLF